MLCHMLGEGRAAVGTLVTLGPLAVQGQLLVLVVVLPLQRLHLVAVTAVDL